MRGKTKEQMRRFDKPTPKDGEIEEQRPLRNDVRNRIIGSLIDLREALEKGQPLPSRFTRRKVRLAEPCRFVADDVCRVRQSLNCSQGVFAGLLGVKVKTVQSWEQSEATPGPSSRRLMEMIEASPEKYIDLFAMTIQGTDRSH